MNQAINIYTDGSCPNNGSAFTIGGWAAVLDNGEKQLRLSGTVEQTTNNRMELTAILEGLKAVRAKEATIVVYTDSNYAKKGCMEWRHQWKRKGWRNSSNKPVENLDLWQQLDELLENRQVELRWVKGHNGHPMNELADRLAVAAANGQAIERKYHKSGEL